jgi:hypothetical protein
VVVREPEERVHIGAASVQVNGDDRARSVADRPGDALRVEGEAVESDVGEDGARARALDACDGRDAGVRRRDHLVARLDADREQGDRQRIRARGDADRVASAAEGGELVLEGAELLREDEPAAAEDATDRAVDLLAVPGGVAREVQKRNGYRSPQ